MVLVFLAFLREDTLNLFQLEQWALPLIIFYNFPYPRFALSPDARANNVFPVPAFPINRNKWKILS